MYTPIPLQRPTSVNIYTLKKKKKLGKQNKRES